MASLTSMIDGTPRTRSRTSMEALLLANEFDWNLQTDPVAPADQARVTEAVAIEEMIAADLTALIEHDTLSKSRTCPAESVGPTSKT